jgi:aromatic ring-opening dioxygenase LigB subunit
MPLVFAGIVPSTPLLLAELSEKRDDSLEALSTAMTTMEQELYLAKPDVCILLSESAATIGDTCTVHTHPDPVASLIHFGNFSKQTPWQGAPDIAAQLLHASYDQHIPVKLESTQILDDESTVILELLGIHIPHIKVLPIGSSLRSIDTNVAIGRLLKDWISSSNKRIAILAAGTLSATHTKDAPFGMMPQSDTFDHDIRHMLQTCNTTAIQSITYPNAQAYHMSLYTPLLMLTGMCQEMDTASYTELAYAVSHGIGFTLGTLSVT